MKYALKVYDSTEVLKWALKTVPKVLSLNAVVEEQNLKWRFFKNQESNNMGLWVVLKVNERLCGARCTRSESFMQEELSVCFW